MTQEENSYFTLNNPSINNKPQPTTNNATTKSGLLNRRQQHASYLPQLELPSLPPLSQLLTTDKVKKENAQQVNNPTSDAAVAAVVAASMMPDMNQYNNQPQPLFYNNATTTNGGNTTTTTTNMTQLMDPTAIPLDTMYNLPNNNNVPTSTATTTAAMVAAAVGYGIPINDPLQHPSLPMQPQQPHQHQHQQRQRQLSSSSASSTEKIYSFVAIPGTNQKKRPRRRYDEIERLYHCNWSGCSKAYGTLNHLNAHVSMQKHGPKRHPAEFKEMRKEWRRQKKEREARKKENEQVQLLTGQQNMMPPVSFNTHFQPYGQLPTGAMSLNGFY